MTPMSDPLEPVLLQEVLTDSLLPAVLKEAQLLQSTAEEREDAKGTWTSQATRYQLEPGIDPAALAVRLQGLSKDPRGSLKSPQDSPKSSPRLP